MVEAAQKFSGYNVPIFIGPISVGKSTIGRMLADYLKIPFCSLDKEEREYIKKVGFDGDKHAKLWDTEGLVSAYRYRRHFFDEAVVRFLEKHETGVLELGGGHPIVPDTEKQQRIIQALARCLLKRSVNDKYVL